MLSSSKYSYFFILVRSSPSNSFPISVISFSRFSFRVWHSLVSYVSQLLLLYFSVIFLDFSILSFFLLSFGVKSLNFPTASKILLIFSVYICVIMSLNLAVMSLAITSSFLLTGYITPLIPIFLYNPSSPSRNYDHFVIKDFIDRIISSWFSHFSRFIASALCTSTFL